MNALEIKNQIVDIIDRRRLGFKYFMVKDYVKGAVYLVDISAANFLFNQVDKEFQKQTSDVSLCIGHLQALNYEFDLDLIHGEHIFYITCNDKKAVLWRNLIKRIKEYLEQSKACDVRFARKMPNEKDRTVKIVGCYKSFEDAKKDYRDYMERNDNNFAVYEKDRIDLNKLREKRRERELLSHALKTL